MTTNSNISLTHNLRLNKISIVWNLTKLCPWACSFCCVNATHVKGKKQVNMARDPLFSVDDELNFKDKCKIIDQLTPGKFSIDFSGGELFIDPCNLDLILYASKKLGSDNIGISTSGIFLTDGDIQKLEGKVKDIELTMDCHPSVKYKFRPDEYHKYAENSIIKLKQHGFFIGVETVLTRGNCSANKLSELFLWLEKNNVNCWSLLRFFPVGRGKKLSDIMLTDHEYCLIVDNIRELTKNSNLDVHFQYLLPNHSGYTTECRCVKKSIGILPNGMVTACFWGLNDKMLPIDNKFILGHLPSENISDILSNKKSLYWSENKHKCFFICE